MHSRILLRGRRSPFDVVTPQATLELNLIWGNTGNLIFLEAAYKLLATRRAEVVLYGRRPDPGDADWINERHDVFVVPLANAFRPRFESHLVALTALIRRLRIPVVVLGVGAQSDLDYDRDGLRPLDGAVSDFARAVLDRSPSIGVRGEFTEAYLRSLGFSQVEVIGCPSMFLFGDRLPAIKSLAEVSPSSRLAISLSTGVPALADIIAYHLERYPNLAYVAQDLDTLALMLLGTDAPLVASHSESFPLSLRHPLFAQDRVRLFIDPWPWIAYLTDVDFALGTRIHGAVAALLAGTPAHVLAHDSRTLELARFFELPHTRTDRLPARVDAADLYARSDFGPMVDGHAARFAAFAEFLAEHQLGHVFTAGEDAQAFDDRVRDTAYPPAVTVRGASQRTPAVLLRKLRYKLRRIGRPDRTRRAESRSTPLPIDDEVRP